jgi:hypothetical protein
LDEELGTLLGTYAGLGLSQIFQVGEAVVQ